MPAKPVDLVGRELPWEFFNRRLKNAGRGEGFEVLRAIPTNPKGDDMKARWTTGLAALAVVGCSGAIGDLASDGPGPRASSSTGSTVSTGTQGGFGGAATTSASSTSTTGPGTTTGGGMPGTGLFCDVQSVLRSRCQSCHTTPLPAGVPMPLVSSSDLMAPGVTDPSRRVADLCVARMKDPQKPMPPVPAVPASASEIAAFETWIAAGAPPTCATGGSGGAGGAGPATPDAGVLQPVVCTSNQHWTG